MHPLTRAALLAATAGAVVAASTAPAGAAPAALTPSAAMPSCVVSIGFAPQPTTVCFRSLGAALTAATGGVLARTASLTDPGALDAGIDAANAANAPTVRGTVIGIENFDRGFAGYSWVVRTPSGCGAVTWQLDQLGDWNNQISSFRTYAGCRADHFDLVGYKGAHTGLLSTRSYIGNRLNDRTSAIRWS